MWRKLARGVGCLGYLGVLGVIFAFVSYFAFSQFVRRGVTPTPELYGLDEEQAEALLADQGLSLTFSSEERFDEQVAAGRVLIQKPRAGTLVKRGVTVTVILSRGPQRIEVPRVLGDALQAAQVSLTAAGLTVGRTINVYSQQGLSGTVVAQQPEGGSRVEPSAAIDLFLALENQSETYLMPDLIYRDLDEVRRYFERRGFRLGRVSYDTYTGRAPGTVLRQYPLAGHPLHRGDVIALDVVTPERPEATEAPPATGEAAGLVGSEVAGGGP
ncbi:MAG: PASTA domain-containing protein [Acidobacteriota bacterium]